MHASEELALRAALSRAKRVTVGFTRASPCRRARPFHRVGHGCSRGGLRNGGGKGLLRLWKPPTVLFLTRFPGSGPHLCSSTGATLYSTTENSRWVRDPLVPWEAPQQINYALKVTAGRGSLAPRSAPRILRHAALYSPRSLISALAAAVPDLLLPGREGGQGAQQKREAAGQRRPARDGPTESTEDEVGGAAHAVPQPRA